MHISYTPVQADLRCGAAQQGDVTRAATVPPVGRRGEGGRLQGLVHMTGGGFWENIPRVVPEGLQARLRRDSWQVPDLFQWLQKARSRTTAPWIPPCPPLSRAPIHDATCAPSNCLPVCWSRSATPDKE